MLLTQIKCAVEQKRHVFSQIKKNDVMNVQKRDGREATVGTLKGHTGRPLERQEEGCKIMGVKVCG